VYLSPSTWSSASAVPAFPCLPRTSSPVVMALETTIPCEISPPPTFHRRCRPHLLLVQVTNTAPVGLTGNLPPPAPTQLALSTATFPICPRPSCLSLTHPISQIHIQFGPHTLTSTTYLPSRPQALHLPDLLRMQVLVVPKLQGSSGISKSRRTRMILP